MWCGWAWARCRAWSPTTTTTIMLAALCCTRLEYSFVVGNAGASDHLYGPKRLSHHHLGIVECGLGVSGFPPPLSMALEVALPANGPVSITTSLGRSTMAPVQTLCLFHWFSASNVVCPSFPLPLAFINNLFAPRCFS
ncbi:hypothetical protein BJV77DRAFT_237662 [Russula vinacea]|nr:hypothetical protein BJV77DRAFT_237662 [Russula vinacea]